jgi:hypothetical protein
MAASAYTRYHYSTTELIKKFKPALSNTFDVYINAPVTFNKGPAVNWQDIHFMAYEAVLPGTSYDLGEVYGDRQGRTEQYPTRRVYPPVDVSFYIDKDYSVIRYFEAWMNSISNNRGNSADSYVTHKYPDQYEGSVTITKWERDLRPRNQRINDPRLSDLRPSNIVKYTLRNAFPSNLISIPVSYEGASLLRTTVTFNYDVYFFETKYGEENVYEPTGSTSGDQGDSPVAGSILPGAEFPNGYPKLESLQDQVNDLREMRLRSQNRIRQQGEVPVTPELIGPPSPIN